MFTYAPLFHTSTSWSPLSPASFGCVRVSAHSMITLTRASRTRKVGSGASVPSLSSSVCLSCVHDVSYRGDGPSPPPRYCAWGRALERLPPRSPYTKNESALAFIFSADSESSLFSSATPLRCIRRHLSFPVQSLAQRKSKTQLPLNICRLSLSMMHRVKPMA